MESCRRQDCPPTSIACPGAPQFLAERPVGTDTALTLPKLTQVFFRYARLSLPCTDPDFARLLVADTVLDGGSMQSRLAVALREEGGDTYTPVRRCRGSACRRSIPFAHRLAWPMPARWKRSCAARWPSFIAAASANAS